MTALQSRGAKWRERVGGPMTALLVCAAPGGSEEVDR